MTFTRSLGTLSIVNHSYSKNRLFSLCLSAAVWGCSSDSASPDGEAGAARESGDTSADGGTPVTGGSQPESPGASEEGEETENEGTEQVGRSRPLTGMY